MKLSIVVPVFEEQETIATLLTQIAQKVKTPNEILIIYDLEKDPTVIEVKKFINKSKIRNIFLIKNSFGNKRGVTNAMKTGFNSAKGNAVVAVMADLSDDLKTVDKMYALIDKGSDLVCGSRYMKGGKKVGGPILKTFLSKIAGLSLYYFFKLPTHDATNAFKMYRKSVLRQIKIESTGGFEYSLEITLKAFKKGFIIKEIPTVWYDRPAGKSNFKLLRWLPKYIKTYFLIVNQNTSTKSIEKWRTSISTNITYKQHLIFLTFSLTLSVLLYSLIVIIVPFSFKVPHTSSINWLTIFNYPKQQDYYFLYSFIAFNFIVTLLIWILWVTLKIRKQQ